MKEKKKEKSAWNIKTRSLSPSPSLSVRARKRNVEKEEEEKSPRKAREGGNKETLFFLSTIFLIKLDQSETELRPWLHLLFKPVKIYYQTRLPTKASINPSSISFYPVDLIVSYSIRLLVTSHNRSFLLEICPLLSRDKGTESTSFESARGTSGELSLIKKWFLGTTLVAKKKKKKNRSREKTVRQ